MSKSRQGFNNSIQGVKYLDKIYDIMRSKMKMKRVGFNYYIVYEDDALTPEVEKLSSHLSKPWDSYKNYSFERTCYNGVMSESEYQKAIARYEEQERQRELEAIKRQQKQVKKENTDRGIYGIYLNGNLIYIGKTDVGFETRYHQHKKAIEEGSESQYLYKYLKDKVGRNEIELVPIINVKDLNTKDRITDRDIKSMELALIHLYKPICNIQGIKMPYKY